MQHQWRSHRHGAIGRHPKPVATTTTNLPEKFESTPKRNSEPIFLEPAEIKALKTCGIGEANLRGSRPKMKVSRNTAWRLAEKPEKNLQGPLSKAEKSSYEMKNKLRKTMNIPKRVFFKIFDKIPYDFSTFCLFFKYSCIKLACRYFYAKQEMRKHTHNFKHS